MNPKRWQPGDIILMYEFLERTRRQLINVRPQVVVEDTPRCLVTVSLPGMSWATRDIAGRNAMPVEERIELYVREELADEWRERIGAAPVLTIFPPSASHSVRLFWDADWHFGMWYINLEDTYIRVDGGIEVNDQTLDVVVTPDFVCSWKDEPEFEALIEAGKIPVEKAQAIRAEGERAIRSIEAREWPFNQPWPDWRPDPAWKAPQVSDYWQPPVG